MNDLERRYHLLLLAFPRRYRERRGEEMVGTLMEAARPDQRYPTARDAADVLTHATRIRLRILPQARPAALVLTAGIGLSLSATLSLVSLLFGELPVWGSDAGLNANQFGFGPFETTGIFAYSLVLAAWLCYLAGRARAARAFAGLACFAVFSTYVASAAVQQRPNLTVLAALVTCLLPQLLSGTARPHQRAVVAALPVVGALLGLATFSGFPTGHPHHWDPRDRFYTDQLGLIGRLHAAVPLLVLVVLTGGALVAVRLRRRDVWLAATMVILPALVIALGGGHAGRTVEDRFRGNTPLIELAVVVLIAAATELILARRWPSPPVGPDAAGGHKDRQ